jgi:hypothetical protein
VAVGDLSRRAMIGGRKARSVWGLTTRYPEKGQQEISQKYSIITGIILKNSDVISRSLFLGYLATSPQPVILRIKRNIKKGLG